MVNSFRGTHCCNSRRKVCRISEREREKTLKVKFLLHSSWLNVQRAGRVCMPARDFTQIHQFPFSFFEQNPFINKIAFIRRHTKHRMYVSKFMVLLKWHDTRKDAIKILFFWQTFRIYDSMLDALSAKRKRVSYTYIFFLCFFLQTENQYDGCRRTFYVAIDLL